MENNEFKIASINNCTWYYFDDIPISEDFDSDNILLNVKSYGIILIYDISSKTLVGAKPLCIILDKVNGFIRDYDWTKYLALKNIMPLVIRLDIL